MASRPPLPRNVWVLGFVSLLTVTMLWVQAIGARKQAEESADKAERNARQAKTESQRAKASLADNANNLGTQFHQSGNFADRNMRSNAVMNCIAKTSWRKSSPPLKITLSKSHPTCGRASSGASPAMALPCLNGLDE